MIRKFCFRAIGSPSVISFVKAFLLYTKCRCKIGVGYLQSMLRDESPFWLQMDSELSQHFAFRLGVSGDHKHTGANAEPEGSTEVKLCKKTYNDEAG